MMTKERDALPYGRAARPRIIEQSLQSYTREGSKGQTAPALVPRVTVAHAMYVFPVTTTNQGLRDGRAAELCRGSLARGRGGSRVGRATGAGVTAPPIEHDAARRRFVAALEEGEGFLSYERVGRDVLDLQHTVVPEAARGQGVGEALVRAAMDHARAHDQRVIPSCPFVEAWLEDHPEARDLVAQNG